MTFEEILKSSNSPAIALRRDLHRFPETAFLEFRTASKVADTLDRMGFEVSVGPEVMRFDAIIDPPSDEAVDRAREAAIAAGGIGKWIDRMPGGQTGVVATRRFGDGPVLAFRFDMDALPVLETDAAGHAPNAQGFRSQWDGRMHACGHDGHVAIGLAAAARLLDAQNLNGTLKLIFQPAEEGARGALPMVAAGVLDDVDYLFVTHLGCLLPSGKIAAEAVGFLNSARWRVLFQGLGAHAAMGPQDGRNALLAGATAALNLHAIARHAGSQTFVNVGSMQAGTTFNVVADKCELLVEVRADEPDAHHYMTRRVMEILEGAAAMHGCTVSTEIKGSMVNNHNSKEAKQIVTDVAGRIAGIVETVPEWPIGGGDDAVFMIKHVQERGKVGGYYILGSDIAAVHHAGNFDFDEEALGIGVDTFVGIAETILSKTSA